MKISLCMIVKNEEENIINCLDRAMELVDEAIIVDTGSTDKTKNLLIENYANNHKVKIFDEKWENDFSKARNKSLEHATGDWILVLDADERVFCNRDRLEEFLNNSNALAYKIPIYNIFDKNSFTVSTSMIRLYKNNNPIYKGAIHEQIQIDGRSHAGEILDENICKIYHYGYNSNIFKEKDKSQRNIDIINAEIKKNPKDPFNWYNKGVMEMIEGNYNYALDDFIKSHNLTNNVRMSYHNDLLIRMIQCMIMLKNYKQAAKFIESISEDSYINTMPDIYYYLGICYVKLKKYDLAINNFQKAVDVGEYYEGISKFGAGSFLSMIELAKVFLLKNEKLSAIKKYKEAVFNKNNTGMQGLDELRRLLQEEKMIDELEQLDKTIASINSKEEAVDYNQLEKVKEEFKDNIQLLIENGMIKEAKEAIEQYEKIVNNDINIYSIKGVIAMMEGDMDEAGSILDKGLLIDSNSNDILYNIAYLYKSVGQIHKAIYFYKKLYYRAENIELKKEIEEEIKAIGGNVRSNVLIGSPIRQKPQILEEFLNSLRDLNKGKSLEVDYFFIDDNDNEESSKLLMQFFKYEKGVILNKSENKDEYICDNNTHNWKEHLVWKVAGFKDRIIEYAKDNNYDYLFFIDSDLVLHPSTLEQLISTGKDIIAEIFWTKWQPNMPELPQVWLKDSYTQYDLSREEILNQNEINRRHKEFIDKLRIPGIYEVGGLGACTLISKYAIDKGISFKEIKNLSFWGEDRHFCIRAAALDLSLYVDTHCPAYHIYREEDLGGIDAFKGRYKAKKITLINTNYSGSNSFAMFKLIPKYIKDKYHIEIINQSNNNEFSYKIMDSDVIIITEGNYHFNKKIFNEKQLVIDLWHGFPLKAMGYADKGEVYKEHIENVWKNIDYIGSYSELFNIIMNECINTNSDKYKILGAPRNDFLFVSSGKKNLSKILGKKTEGKKIIFYMPTYRYTARGNRKDGKRNWDNYFGFDNFDQERFSQFLIGNDVELVLKLHPADEALVINKFDTNCNISLITNRLLQQNGLDLYETLNGCDLLITDYSSVYFDLLLLDKPMIFTPTDLKEYEDSRGFLLEPYDNWTPGPKCLSQASLEEEILKSLSNKDYYKKERTSVLNKVHHYKDGYSSKRTWDFIDSLINIIDA